VYDFEHVYSFESGEALQESLMKRLTEMAASETIVLQDQWGLTPILLEQAKSEHTPLIAKVRGR
jgi:hypothetical protein